MQPAALTIGQIEVFDSLRRAVLDSGFAVPLFHCANSAAALDFPASHFDAIRPGLSLYGQYPSAEVRQRVPLRQAMTVKTRIAFLKEVPAGTGLSYGHTFVTARPSRIATVPFGYADGYPRHASNRTAMLVRRGRAPVVGRVCMDQTLLDVTDIPGVAVGDEVLVFGISGDDMLPADAVAAAAGTIGYEMTTRIGRRLPRFFTA
jgi:alanine racemase